MNIEDLHSLVSEKLVNHIQSQALVEPNILTTVLIGKTGEGKSSTGNSLLKDKRFRRGFGQNSETRETNGESTPLTVDGTEYQLLVIDTPGLFDTSRSKEEIEAQIRRCIFIDSNHSSGLIGSIHAFFLVMKTDSRFTPEMQNTLDVIATIFGGLHMNHYLFVAFTRADDMASEGITEEEFMKTYINAEVLEKIKETGNDPIFVNNRLMDNLDSNCAQIDNWRQNVIRRIVSNLKSRLHGVPYSYINFATDPIQSEASQLKQRFEELKVAEDELNEYLNNLEKEYIKLGKIAGGVGVVGSAFGLVIGLPLILTGIALAVPTLGWSLPLIDAGTAVSATGSVIAGGGEIIGKLRRTALAHQAENKVKNFFEKAIHLSEELNRVGRELLKAKIQLWPAVVALKLSKVKVRAQAENPSEIYLDDSDPVAEAPVRFMTGAGQTALLRAIRSSDDILKLIGAAASMVSIVGTAVGAVIDVTCLAFTVHRLAKSKGNAKEKFDELRNKLNIVEIRIELETLLAELEEFRSKPKESCMCSICLNLWDTPVVCPATHMHVSGCQKCLAEWHQREESPSCPICRQPWSNISTIPDDNRENENEAL